MNGKFKNDRIQPYLFGKCKVTWNKTTILEVISEIVRDQIGCSLKDEEQSDSCITKEIVAIEEIKINNKNKIAQVCFSVTLCSRDGSDDKIEAGYYFVNLALDENLNVVDVNDLLFDSKRGQKTKHEIHQAFGLYLANTSEDFGLGYDPLGLMDRKGVLTEPDFSPDLPIIPTVKARVAE
jgi:hypothetical protein